ncbi:hypothetical protein RAMLITH_23285 [Ramlibacter sp. RBP-2]|uniref:Uncharacterized protein n=1 Tax=Ramlibacter lithotrophicus TaxID=2606681 RepID=A0A7X6DKC0_9BURK|nr:hypothetical protein [Ramlibacter lithotrophicus]NKE68750.1 hypothetical protein [Ramlibacter lithotrophicus]
MAAGTADQSNDGPSWVVGSRERAQGPLTLYVWAPARQLEGVKRQLGVELRVGMMDIAQLHRAMATWTARFGATERQQADWEEFAGGARVEIAILMEPSPREPVPLLLHGVDSIRALAAAVPPGRPVPVLFARLAPRPVAPVAPAAPAAPGMPAAA